MADQIQINTSSPMASQARFARAAYGWEKSFKRDSVQLFDCLRFAFFFKDKEFLTIDT